MSPTGHEEYKHAHDHKDLDLFVPPRNVGAVMGVLMSYGFAKATTKHDRKPSAEDFRRYEKTVEVAEHPNGALRLTIDFFVAEHPTLVTPEGWSVVRPDVLLSFYGKVHDSDKCWAVQAARLLLEHGEQVENLVGRGDLLACPELPGFVCTHCRWSGQFPRTHWDTTQDWGGGNSIGFPVCPQCNYSVLPVGPPTYRPKSEFLQVFNGAMIKTGRSPDGL